MPTKRRTPKRRAAGSEEMDAWTDVFLFGCDFSRDLQKAGISPLGRPDRATLEQAWRRMGTQFLAQWDGHGHREIWAVRELGDPDAS